MTSEMTIPKLKANAHTKECGLKLRVRLRPDRPPPTNAAGGGITRGEYSVSDATATGRRSVTEGRRRDRCADRAISRRCSGMTARPEAGRGSKRPLAAD